MTLEEYKESIKAHVAAHNDFNINVDDLFKYAEDAKLEELCRNNVPIPEAAMYCLFAGIKINGKKKI